MSSRLTEPSWTVATGPGIRFPGMDRITKDHSRSWLAKQFVQIEATLRVGITDRMPSRGHVVCQALARAVPGTAIRDAV